MGHYPYNYNRKNCSYTKKKEWRPTLRYMLEDEGYSEEEISILSEEYKKRAQKELEFINVEAVEEHEYEELETKIKNKNDEKKLINNEIKDLKRKRKKLRKNGLFKLISKFISRNNERER